jgi:hypothetical protein
VILSLDLTIARNSRLKNDVDDRLPIERTPHQLESTPAIPSLPLVGRNGVSLADENLLAGNGKMSPGFGA